MAGTSAASQQNRSNRLAISNDMVVDAAVGVAASAVATDAIAVESNDGASVAPADEADMVADTTTGVATDGTTRKRKRDLAVYTAGGAGTETADGVTVDRGARASATADDAHASDASVADADTLEMKWFGGLWCTTKTALVSCDVG